MGVLYNLSGLIFNHIHCKIGQVLFILSEELKMSEEPISAEPVDEISSDDKLWAALAYFFAPIVSIIILLMDDKKDRPFIKAHNVQALVAGIVMSIIIVPIAAITLGCGSIIYLIMWYWAYKAYQGEYINIPVITDFVKNQGWA